MPDYSRPEVRAMYEREVKRRMEAPFHMSRSQAEMLVAALLHENDTKQENTDGR